MSKLIAVVNSVDNIARELQRISEELDIARDHLGQNHAVLADRRLTFALGRLQSMCLGLRDVESMPLRAKSESNISE